MDRELALLLARQNAIGYLPSFLSDPVDTARAALPALGLEFVDIVWGTDFKGLFGQQRVPYAVVADDPNRQGQRACMFRGTDTENGIGLKEWATDFEALFVNCPFAPGRSHSAITQLYGTMEDSKGLNVRGSLVTHDAIVGGHSLGGFVGTALGADLGSNCRMVCTFEGGRFFDAVGAAAMDKLVPAHFRHVIIGDEVPHAPPEVLGYRHAGIEIDLDPSHVPGLVPADASLFDRARLLHILSSVITLLEAA